VNLSFFLNHKIQNRYQQNLRIANIDISVTSPYPTGRIIFGKAYQNFFYPSKHPEASIHTYYGAIPQFTLLDKYLISGIEDMWGIYSVGGKKVFVLRPIKYKKGKLSIFVKGNIKDNKDAFCFKLRRDYDMKPVKTRICQPFRVAVSKPDFTESSVFIDSKLPFSSLANPLGYPLLELLLPNLLSSKRGVLLHACGVVDRNKGYLFLGHSGYGKTTMAKLWRDSGGVILHDDLIPVRKVNGTYLAFPIPGYGATFSKKLLQGVPVSKIFFLYHSPRNVVSHKTGILAATLLLLRSLQPTPDVKLIKNIQNFCAQITKTIPCYSLGFVPDRRVLDFIREIN
jgi:hypothetical protein